jgi:hypothetical protein
MIRLAFYKADGEWIDRVIRWWASGPYSHVELVLGDPSGPVTVMSASPRDRGVRERQLTLNPAHWDLLAVPGDEAAAVAFIRTQTGVRYDWLGIAISQVMGICWTPADRWFCSELMAAAINAANPLRPTLPTCIEPNQLWRRLRRGRY